MQKELTFENVPVAWVFLDKPDDNNKFRLNIQFDKNNKQHVDYSYDLEDAVKEVLEDGLRNEADWKGKEPSKVLALKDGDDSEYEFEHGHWIVAASSKSFVPIADERAKPGRPDMIKPGNICNVIARVYSMGGKYGGVYLSLEAVQKVSNGTPFSGGGGGGVDIEKAFKDTTGGRGSRDERDRRSDDRSRDDRGGRDERRDDSRGSRDDRDSGGRRDDRDDRRDSRSDDRGGRDDRRDDRGRDDRDSRGSRDDRRDDRRDERRDDRDTGRRDDDRNGSRDDGYERGRERGRDRF